MELRQLSPTELSAEDLVLLERGCQGSYDKATAEDQLRAVKSGSAWIFKTSGKAEVLFVLSRGDIASRELVISAVAGKGMISNFPEFYEMVKELALKAGAKRLTGFVSRRGLCAVYMKHTSADVAAVVLAEDLR